MKNQKSDEKSVEKHEKPPKRKSPEKTDLIKWLKAHGHKAKDVTSSLSAKGSTKDAVMNLHTKEKKKDRPE